MITSGPFFTYFCIATHDQSSNTVSIQRQPKRSGKLTKRVFEDFSTKKNSLYYDQLSCFMNKSFKLGL